MKYLILLSEKHKKNISFHVLNLPISCLVLAEKKRRACLYD